MGLEIERKFLLKNSQILDFLKEAGVVFKHLEISQFYTKITQNEEIRFRSEEGKFIKTIKVGKDLIREENEEFCEKVEFKKALKNRIGRVITKDRYIFRLNNNPCNIDVFKDIVGSFVVDLFIFVCVNGKKFIFISFIAGDIGLTKLLQKWWQFKIYSLIFIRKFDLKCTKSI